MDEEGASTIQMDESPLISQAGCPARYKIKCVIGQGATGLVFRAYDTEMQREVSIKVLSSEGTHGKDSQERFLREAKTLFALNHPNVVRIHSSGINEHGKPYHVMEYLEGETLARVLDRGPLSQEAFYACVSQVSSALSYAHGLKIVHRDLKPSNIIYGKEIDGQDTYKVIDFGLARFDLNSDLSPSLTGVDVVIGTPAYISPEQCRGKKADARSDIYSFACIMYECISGHPPFSGESALDVMQKHLNEIAPSLLPASGSADAKRLATLIDKCLLKDPDMRPQSMDEISLQIKEIFNSTKTPIELFGGRSAKKNKLWLLPVLMAILLAVCLLVAVVLHYQSAPKNSKVVFSKQEQLSQQIDKLSLKKRKDLKDYLALGRMQLQSERVQDNAEASKTYSDALRLCKSDANPIFDQRALCMAMLAKSAWKQGNYDKSAEYFDKALKIIDHLNNPEAPEMKKDVLLERILLNIHCRNFSLALKDYREFSDSFGGAGLVLLTQQYEALSQRLDRFGPNRPMMIYNIAIELHKMKPESEAEAISIVELNNVVLKDLRKSNQIKDFRSSIDYSMECLKMVQGHEQLKAQTKQLSE